MKTLLHTLLRTPLAWLALSLAACGGGNGTDSAGGAPTFAKSYGGPARDHAAAAVTRPGGGYAFAGTLNNRLSGAGRINGLFGYGNEGDLWVTALDAFGDVQWQRSYGRVSVVPDGALPIDADRDISYHQVRAALDTENDGRRNGAWLAGRVIRPAPGATSPRYSESDADLLITRLDADNRVVFSRSYDSGPFPGFAFHFSDERTSDATAEADIWPTADGGAIAAANSVATVTDNGNVLVKQALFVLKVDAAGNRQASALIPVDFAGRRHVLVRPMPLGAVAAYATPAGMTVMRLDFSTSGASIRWRRDFESDEVPRALLVADDDGDSAPDGIVVAGTDLTLVAPGFGDDIDGFVIKLDPATGEQRWRRDLGTVVAALASTCGVSGAPCRYAAAGQDRDGVLVRTLDMASGSTLAERKIADATSSVGIRHLASPQRFQLLTSNSDSLDDVRLVTLDAALGVSSIVQVPRLGSGDSNNLVPDAGSSHLAYSGERLLTVDAFGVVREVATLSGGETTLERGYSLQALPGDSGFVVAGEMFQRQTASAWLLRLDTDGGIVWQKRFDNLYLRDRDDDFGDSRDLLRASTDGGLLIGGYTAERHQRVIKLDSDGRITWSTRALEPKTRGGPLRALRAAADGSVYTAGNNDGAPWVARLDERGAVQWHFRYAHSIDNLGVSDLRTTADGGSLIAGAAGNVNDPEDPEAKAAAAIRLDADGRVVWANSYPLGRSTVRRNVRVAPAADGGFVMASSVESGSPGLLNLQLVKIDGDGAVQWSQRYGGLYEEAVHGLEATGDGGFIVSAQSDSLGDYTEAWVLRVGPDGRIAEGCNADLGRGGVVARPLSLTRQTYALPDSAEATAPPLITPVDTDVVAREPSDVVVARQCAGTAGNNSGAPTNPHTLTVRQAGPLTGVVSSTPSGIVCGTGASGACSAAYAEGSLVSLRVDIGSVSNFSAWGAGCESVSGNFGEICSVRLDADKTIDVIFRAAPPPPPPAGPFTLTVMIDRLGGFIGTTDGAIGCVVTAGQPRTCAARYAAGTNVDLYAASLPGGNVLLESWQGDCARFGAQPNITLTMDRDYSCRAVFVSAPP